MAGLRNYMSRASRSTFFPPGPSIASSSRTPLIFLTVSRCARHASTTPGSASASPSGPEVVSESSFGPNESDSGGPSSRPRQSFRQRWQNMTPKQRRWLKILGYSMLVSTAIHVPIVIYLLRHDTGEILPYEHVARPISKLIRLTPRHKYLEIPLEPESARRFGDAALGMDGETLSDNGAIAVQHITIKSPAIQVERSYTPVNDVQADGAMQLVVKRVRGGEVGRVVFSLKEGERIWVRGPVTTFAINPYEFDRIVMISTGTGVAPFLQLLHKIHLSSTASDTPRTPVPTSDLIHPPLDGGSPRTTPKLHLIHALPPADHSDADWPVSMGYLPRLAEKFGDSLSINRTPQGPIPQASIASALGENSISWIPWRNEKRKDERVMVLVSLPPSMMDPICGRMTPDFQQGELTGVLRELGLKPHQVWKLE